MDTPASMSEAKHKSWTTLRKPAGGVGQRATWFINTRMSQRQHTEAKLVCLVSALVNALQIVARIIGKSVPCCHSEN